MKILAIESSCDETAAAVIGDEGGHPEILSNIVSSQIDLHSTYGGVVPELAARAHIESIIPVIKEALAGANMSLKDIGYLAVTHGPGLIGSLVVGVETAKALSVATGLPLVPVNHLEGHIYAAFSGQFKSKKLKVKSSEVIEFPVLTLLVSGGNTMLIIMKGHGNYEVVGQTIDDAAGEAFDKGAKLLGLGYPGGPIISQRAAEGDCERFPLPVIDLTPKPKRNAEGFMQKSEPSLDFSFSGLKTALLTEVKKLTINDELLTDKQKNDLSASYETAIVETLVQNAIRAILKYRPKTFILAGGVAANSRLRVALEEAIRATSPKTNYLIPLLSLCGDNAAMIGLAAYYRTRLQATSYRLEDRVAAVPNLKIA